MPRKYKRTFTIDAILVIFFCALIVGNVIGLLVYIAINSYWLAFGAGMFGAYAVIDVLMRSPNE